MLLVGEEGLYPLLEEVVGLPVLLHLQLPLRPLELFAHFYQVFEVVEGEDPAGLVDDEGGEEAELEVDVGREADLAEVVARWLVFQDIELVLELDQVWIFGDLEVYLLLEGKVGRDGLG